MIELPYSFYIFRVFPLGLTFDTDCYRCSKTSSLGYGGSGTLQRRSSIQRKVSFKYHMGEQEEEDIES